MDSSNGVRIWFKMLSGEDRITMINLTKGLIDLRLDKIEGNTYYKFAGYTRSGHRKYVEMLVEDEG